MLRAQWVSSHGADFEMMLIKKHPPGSGWEFLHDGESVAAQYYRACLLFELQSQIEIAAVRRPLIDRLYCPWLCFETELTRGGGGGLLGSAARSAACDRWCEPRGAGGGPRCR